MTVEDEVRSRLVGVKWVQQRLGDHAPHCVRELSVLLGATGRKDRLLATLRSPQTHEWLDTMVRLIDRHAPTVLPDGQFAAHAAAVVNLTAGLSESDTVTVRFDEFGSADLPALGSRISGGFAAAGLQATVDLNAPPPELTVTPLDGPSRVADRVAAAPTAKPGKPAAEPPAVAHIVARWTSEHRPLPPTRHRTPDRPMSPRLLALLVAAGIPTAIEPNYATTQAIRNDNSFDHLSLLSVRQPEEFAAIKAAAADDPSHLGRRISGHCAYIGRRFVEAADEYAALLLGNVEDLDLWRDFCWAMRHAGLEEGTRCWVMHPTEVVAVAQQVGFDVGRGSPSDMIGDYLEWVSRDLG